AGHGSASPFDVHNTLMAAGPDLKRASTATTPTANVDLAPTILTSLGVAVPASMQGRVISEAFVTGPDARAQRVRTEQHTATTADGRYSSTATFSIMEATGRTIRYLDAAGSV